MSKVSIKVTVPGSDQPSYLPVGAVLEAIDGETGERLDKFVQISGGAIVVSDFEPA